ncbi:MAG: ATP-dependent zinc metalloprotease FtsH [Saprospiraceae bacterium]|nr:ATP-dependent zinc metalloprotease FtsH [Saprospiraceae bacterium]
MNKNPAPDIPEAGSKPSRWIFLLYALIAITLVMFFWYRNEGAPEETTWQDFVEKMLIPQDVEKLEVVNGQKVNVFIKTSKYNDPKYSSLASKMAKNLKVPLYYYTIGSVDVFYNQLHEAEQGMPLNQQVPVTYINKNDWGWTILMWILPFLLLVFLWSRMLRGTSSGMQGMNTSIFNFGQSQARVTESGNKSTITFAQVAGMDEAKEEISEIVKFLKNPTFYTRLGAKIPKGILLVGPPGTGKTLLAKAVAGEAGVPFFSLSGSEFIEMFVGVGAARMRDLFAKAKAKAPSIVFIDEIDTIGRVRGKAYSLQSNDERDSTLNQLLAELDGFDTSTGVIVLAATNRGDILDSALLRPGRFDRHIHLELPNINERKAIFLVHLKPVKTGQDVNVDQLASQTPGFSGADIANICNEAALIAARSEKNSVDQADFNQAVDRVIGGLEKKSKVISPSEKRRIAFHEAGHVITGWFLPHATPALKVSIIPRGKSLGAAWYLPEEHQIVTREEFLDTISMALGGRAAEELVFGEISSNALDDLEKATKQAYSMVVYYGLSNALGHLSYYDASGRTEQSLVRPYSEKTAEIIDDAVRQLIEGAYAKATEILTNHRNQLDDLAELLIRKEVVYQEEIRQITGHLPTNQKQNYVSQRRSI